MAKLSKELRVAVLGAGNIASKHLPVLAANPDTAIVAICEPEAERRAAAAAEYAIEQQFADVDALIEWGGYDVVWVLVSHRVTAPVAERFIRLGVPTFLEKPPGITVAETEGLVRAVEESGTIAQVGLNRRFYTSTLAARETLLETGPVLSVTVEGHEDIRKVWNDPRLSESHRRRRVFSNTIHALDLLRLFGGDVQSVTGFFARFTNPMPDAYTGYLQFESGAIGRAVVDHFGDRGTGHQVEVRTATATIRSYDGFNRYVLTRQDGEPQEIGLSGDDLQFKPGFPGQTRAFVQALRAGRQPEWPAASIWEGLATMRMIESISCADQWPAD